jgi:PleD family two-component response regulator
MIKLLAKIGRLNTVIIITLIAVAASLAATMAAVALLDDLLARADLALYQARQSGRNKTATFNPQLTQAAAG